MIKPYKTYMSSTCSMAKPSKISPDPRVQGTRTTGCSRYLEPSPKSSASSASSKYLGPQISVGYVPERDSPKNNHTVVMMILEVDNFNIF